MRRAQRSFWLLVVLAALAMGVLSTAVTSAPSPGAALTVTTAGAILAGALALATRVLVALDRARRAVDRDKPRASIPAWLSSRGNR